MSKIVTFEQAKKLNGLGYTERSEYAYLLHQKSGNHKLYSPFGRMDYNQNNNRDNSNKIAIHYSAPTVSEALDWVREEKGIACGTHPIARHDKDLKFICWEYTYAAFDGKIDLFCNAMNLTLMIHPTHPIASSALLDAVLTYLEQKEKKQ